MLNQRNTFRVSPLMGLIMFILFMVFIYMMIKGLFALASYIMPVLVIATLLIDYKVYMNYGKFLIDLFQKSFVTGILGSALTFFLFPLVILFLFTKAIFTRFVLKSVKKNPIFQEQKSEDEYIEFEEVEDEEVPFIELPPVEPKSNPKDNPYDGYFK